MTLAPRARPSTAAQPRAARLPSEEDRAQHGLDPLRSSGRGRSTLEADTYPASQDQRHELKLVDSAKFGYWTVSGTFIVATGKPYTDAIGISTISIGDGDRTIGFPDFGPKNGARLPAYHRLDLALSYDHPIGSARGSFGVTVFNVYNRKNVWYKEFQAFSSELVENDVHLMGLAVNAFVGLRF
jgi:hypothetical protein